MASGFSSVGSVLTERPPSDEPLVTPVARSAASTHHLPAPQRPMPTHSVSGHGHSPTPAVHQAPSTYRAPLTQHPSLLQSEPLIKHTPVAPVTQESPPQQTDRGAATGNRAWYDSLLSGREYEVVYDDADGYPLLAFADGQWYDVTSFTARPVSVRHAIHLDPAWAGAVVQTICSWMRSNPNHDRSFELATELALAVGELARIAAR